MQVGLQYTSDALPEGLLSHLFSHGTLLTSEQCLRLTLARVIAGRPRLMLLDGILDRIVNPFLFSLLDILLAADAPWTLIVVSQKPEVISRCKRHAIIKQGRFIEMTPENQGED